MSNVDDLKLRQFSLQSQEAQAMMSMPTALRSATSSKSGSGQEPAFSVTGSEVVVYGSRTGSGSGSKSDPSTCPKCGAKYEWGVCPNCDKGSASGSKTSSSTTFSGSGVSYCFICGGQLVPIPGTNYMRCTRCGNVLIKEVVVYGSTIGSQPSSGGGGNPTIPTIPPTPPKEQEKPKTKQPIYRDDCDQKAVSNSSRLTKVINKGQPLAYMDNKVDVAKSIAKLRDYASNSSVEHGMPISFDTDSQRYYVPYAEDNSDGISSGTGVNVKIGYTETTYMKIHTHPSGTIAAPSPRDLTDMYGTIKYQMDKKNEIKISASIIFANGGTEYAIIVDDIMNVKNTLLKFTDSKHSDYKSFFHSANDLENEFIAGSIWQTQYKEMYNNMKSDGYSDEDAQAYSLAYILDSKKMGLKIVKRDDATGEFKELKTEFKDGKYIAKICP